MAASWCRSSGMAALKSKIGSTALCHATHATSGGTHPCRQLLLCIMRGAGVQDLVPIAHAVLMQLLTTMHLLQ
eukprot:scaffold81936_cov20-Tisochrysis_lutea.AAC.1